MMFGLGPQELLVLLIIAMMLGSGLIAIAIVVVQTLRH